MTEDDRHSDPRGVQATSGRRDAPVAEQRAQPTAERIRRAGADFERGDTGQITMRDSPLERAYARKLITRQQYSADRSIAIIGITPVLRTNFNPSTSTGSLRPIAAISQGWRKPKSRSFIDNDTGRRRRRWARSAHMSWTG